MTTSDDSVKGGLERKLRPTLEPGTGIKVLLVEDSPTHITRALETLAGYEVTQVSNYQEAVGALGIAKGTEQKEFDVVLTDLFFPYGTSKGPISVQEKILNPEPLGYPIALLAAMKGISYVGIVTDANHHDGPMEAATDELTLAIGRVSSVFGRTGTKMYLLGQTKLGISTSKNYSQVMNDLASPL